MNFVPFEDEWELLDRLGEQYLIPYQPGMPLKNPAADDVKSMTCARSGKNCHENERKVPPTPSQIHEQGLIFASLR